MASSASFRGTPRSLPLGRPMTLPGPLRRASGPLPRVGPLPTVVSLRAVQGGRSSAQDAPRTPPQASTGRQVARLGLLALMKALAATKLFQASAVRTVATCVQAIAPVVEVARAGSKSRSPTAPGDAEVGSASPPPTLVTDDHVVAALPVLQQDQQVMLPRDALALEHSLLAGRDTDGAAAAVAGHVMAATVTPALQEAYAAPPAEPSPPAPAASMTTVPAASHQLPQPSAFVPAASPNHHQQQHHHQPWAQLQLQDHTVAPTSFLSAASTPLHAAAAIAPAPPTAPAAPIPAPPVPPAHEQPPPPARLVVVSDAAAALRLWAEEVRHMQTRRQQLADEVHELLHRHHQHHHHQPDAAGLGVDALGSPLGHSASGAAGGEGLFVDAGGPEFCPLTCQVETAPEVKQGREAVRQQVAVLSERCVWAAADGTEALLAPSSPLEAQVRELQRAWDAAATEVTHLMVRLVVLQQLPAQPKQKPTVRHVKNEVARHLADRLTKLAALHHPHPHAHQYHHHTNAYSTNGNGVAVVGVPVGPAPGMVALTPSPFLAQHAAAWQVDAPIALQTISDNHIQI